MSAVTATYEAHVQHSTQSLGVREHAALAGARDGRKARTGEPEVTGKRALGSD